MGLYENTENGLKLLAGSTLYADAPIGAIQAFGGATAPSGWFICDGSAKSRTDFAELFAVIGTAFGTGDGSTTFNLPDLREAVPKGAGLTGHTVGAHLDADGLAVGEFLDDRVQSHTHSYQFDYGLYAGSGNVRVGDDKIHNGNTGTNSGRTGDTTEVKSVGVNYIIKAKQVGLPADLEQALEDALKPNILWTNQSPDAVFNPQTISFENGNYNYLTIYYKEYMGRNYYQSQKIPKGVNVYLNKIDVAIGSYYVYMRQGSYVSDKSFSFGDAYQSGNGVSNGHLIPIQIVGSMN